MNQFSPFATWLSETGISLALQNTFWVVPLTQAIHILAIAALLTSAVMLNGRLAGLTGRQEILSDAVGRFGYPVRRALIVLLVTGIALVIAEPERELENQLFGIKMILVVSSTILTLWAFKNIDRVRFVDLPLSRRSLLVGLASLSTLLWLAIIFCGRWIAYADTLGA